MQSLENYFSALKEKIDSAQLYKISGKVSESVGLILKARLPGVRIGELCYIRTRNNVLRAEVVGFKNNEALLMPFGDLFGIGSDSEVMPSGRPFFIRCGDSLLGRVLNGCGEAIDGKEDIQSLSGLIDWPVERSAPNPYTRQPVDTIIPLGVRAIDGLLSVGRGQRVGLFAGSGVGKSMLLGQLARNTSADIVVACLVGERGREVLDFINDALGSEAARKSVIVVATSNEPSLIRAKSCFVATAIAEWFRDQGANVLFMMDSVTRFARAQREIGLAAGEPPARQGFPPSVFAHIPRLLERTGNNHIGSITAIYTVLVQAGDMEEPIADEIRGILDGHFYLDRKLAEKNHWPALSILSSLSRTMNTIASPQHKNAATRLREVLALYEKKPRSDFIGRLQKW